MEECDKENQTESMTNSIKCKESFILRTPADINKTLTVTKDLNSETQAVMKDATNTLTAKPYVCPSNGVLNDSSSRVSTGETEGHDRIGFQALMR